MCCSIRAAVFFTASIQIFFAIAQMVQTLPIAVLVGDKLLESTMSFIFCIGFFTTGFILFRGADQESAINIKFGTYLLIIILIFRFILMSFNLMLIKQLPEAIFLYVYGTHIIPIIFTTVIYFVYIALLFCYHNELIHSSSNGDEIRLNFKNTKRNLCKKGININ